MLVCLGTRCALFKSMHKRINDSRTLCDVANTDWLKHRAAPHRSSLLTLSSRAVGVIHVTLATSKAIRRAMGPRGSPAPRRLQIHLAIVHPRDLIEAGHPRLVIFQHYRSVVAPLSCDLHLLCPFIVRTLVPHSLLYGVGIGN